MLSWEDKYQCSVSSKPQEWVAKTSSGTSRDWYCLSSSADGQILVAGTYLGYIYISKDSGNTWEAKGHIDYWFDIAISADGTKIIACSGLGYIYISSDLGNTFVSSAFTGNWLSVCLSNTGSILYSCEGSGYIYISNNSGVTWEQIGINKPYTSLKCSQDGSKIFATTSNDNFYVSLDYGNSWNAKSIIRYWQKLAVSYSGEIILAIGDGYLQVSLDYGNSFTQKFSNKNWTCVASNFDSSLLLAGDVNGYIYYSDNYGDSWEAGNVTGLWYSIASDFSGYNLSAIDIASYVFISNTVKLKKEYTIVNAQNKPTQQWIPGYSYFKPDFDAELSSSGKDYVIARLNSLGFTTVGFVPITKEQLVPAFNYTNIKPFPDYPIYYFCNYDTQWNVGFDKSNLFEFALPVLTGPILHTSVNSYFDTRPEGEIVNVPSSYSIVTPEPYKQQVPIIGWNAGALSESMFTSIGTASFSIKFNSVGVFTGLCEQSIAIQDQRPERIKYAIYSHLGIYSVYVDNIKKTNDSSYIEEDVFKIVISKTLVSFYKNGLLIYSETKVDNNTVYVLDCSLYYSDDAILNASIGASTTLDSYSSGIGTLTYVGIGISKNYSIGQGTYTYTGTGSNLVEIDFTQEYSGLGISYNYSIGSGLQEYTGQSSNYPSRMDGTLTYTGFGISKNHSIGQGNISYTGLGEAGGIIPTVPPIGLGYMVYTGFSRNVYILPPQIFVIT